MDETLPPANLKSISSLLKAKGLRLGLPEWLLALCIASYTIYASHLTIMKHHSYNSSAWDLGIFLQALWTTVHSHKLLYYTVELHVNPGGSFLGTHFSPILLLLAPLYALSPRAETLLTLQSLSIALAAVPLYLITRDKLGSKYVALAVSAAYLLYLPIHELNWFDFHFEAFIPVTLLSAYYFFERASYVKAYFSFLLALSCCEFMPIPVSCFALYFILKAVIARLREGSWSVEVKRRLFHGEVLLLLSLAWFHLALHLIHHFNPAAKVAGNWEYWGSNPAEILVNLLSNPARALAFILTISESICSCSPGVGFLKSDLNMPRPKGERREAEARLRHRRSRRTLFKALPVKPRFFRPQTRAMKTWAATNPPH
ncbi:MAG: hypothetical protein DRO52_02925 [Candidatus Hecatellales archaeon]|nr:MAG: hypothetical protein DRO52_02925 [Candidatus Hecatellales archaeon]